MTRAETGILITLFIAIPLFFAVGFMVGFQRATDACLAGELKP